MMGSEFSPIFLTAAFLILLGICAMCFVYLFKKISEMTTSIELLQDESKRHFEDIVMFNAAAAKMIGALDATNERLDSQNQELIAIREEVDNLTSRFPDDIMKLWG